MFLFIHPTYQRIRRCAQPPAKNPLRVLLLLPGSWHEWFRGGGQALVLYTPESLGWRENCRERCVCLPGRSIRQYRWWLWRRLQGGELRERQHGCENGAAEGILVPRFSASTVTATCYTFSTQRRWWWRNMRPGEVMRRRCRGTSRPEDGGLP